MPSAPAEVPDGRQSRTARSRRAICDACLDLVQEGVLQPSADQVAERAGVSRRSVFNHFADLAELYDAVIEAGMQRCDPLREEIPPHGPLAERIARLAQVRARFFEATTPLRDGLNAQALVGPAPDQALRVARVAVRPLHQEIEQLFAGELAHLAPAERAEVLEALAAAASAPHWDYLRRARGSSVARARAVMQRSLAAILQGAGADRASGR